MASFDDRFGKFPFHPSLRIAPLLDPLPFFSATSDRPSPLEPNARVNVNIDNETAKLTGRRKALAEAKPLGDSGANDLRPLQKSSRRRHKLYDHERIAEFVQLPKPKAKAKEEKPPPFQPIAVLNELLEPPPSAALFPPITPSARQDEQDWLETSAKLVKSGESLAVKRKSMEENSDAPPARRLNARPRMRWSEEETDQLVKGVAIYGMGKWKKILHHAEFSFLPGRTPVDLKDRFRTCFPQKLPDKSRPSTSNIGGPQPHESSDCPLDAALIPTNTPPVKQTPRPPSSRSPGPNRKKARKRPWSKEEDEALAEGYRQHGFQWTLMARDPSFKFANRSGPQVRDRFRLKYPNLYEQGGSTGPELMWAGNEGTARRASSSAALKIKAFQEESEDREYEDTDSEPDDWEAPSQKPAPAAANSFAAPLVATAPRGITSLLNGDEEDNRPSASLGLDDCDENVTLPPLLQWEDIATRPLFDI